MRQHHPHPAQQIGAAPNRDRLIGGGKRIALSKSGSAASAAAQRGGQPGELRLGLQHIVLQRLILAEQMAEAAKLIL
jgi:hypothetical protein